jgi:hypothetical protein
VHATRDTPPTYNRIGASDAVPETIEASLQLSEAVLVDLGVAMGPVIASVHEQRATLQARSRRWRQRRRCEHSGAGGCATDVTSQENLLGPPARTGPKTWGTRAPAARQPDWHERLTEPVLSLSLSLVADEWRRWQPKKLHHAR